MSALICPDREQHRSDDPHASRHIGDDAQRVVALLSEGYCPACPTERLDRTTITRTGRDWDVLHCSCCDATYELDGTTYAVHDRGRLVES